MSLPRSRKFRARLLFLSCFSLLTSCSIFSAAPPKALPLAEVPAGETQLELSSLDARNARVYQTLVNGHTIYSTAVRQCPYSDTEPLVAAVRKLLVGLKRISVVRQRRSEFAGRPFLQSEITANYDSAPISLTVFSLRENGCLTDLIAWHLDKDGHDTQQSREEVLQSVLTQLEEPTS